MDDPVQSFDMRTRTKARLIRVNLSTLAITAGRAGDHHLFRDVTATKEFLSLIQERLSAPAKTVRNHILNILGTLGAHSRLEAVATATRQRLL
jgi:hypothetical protein